MSQSHLQVPARKAPPLQRILNAYAINLCSDRPWRVQLVSVEATSGRELDHGDRSAAKNSLFDSSGRGILTAHLPRLRACVRLAGELPNAFILKQS